MSGGMYGADVEALRLLADKIAEGGDTLDTVVLTVEGAIPGPEGWEGPDGDGFRAEWGDTHVVRLRSTADLLRDVATKVRENADDQQATSDDYTGTAGGTGGSGGSAGGGGGGGGGGGAGDEDGGNPLTSPGADPLRDRTDTSDPDHHWTDGYDGRTENAREGSYEYQYRGGEATADDQVTSSEMGSVGETLAEAETSGFVGYDVGTDGSFGSDDGAHGSGEAGFAAGAGYDAGASASISENGLVAEANAGVSVGASANASGEVGYGDHLSAAGSAEAMVGARADANAGASIGPHGVGVSAGFDAFAGAEAGLDGSVTAAGVTAGGSAEVYAGAGIKADADVNFGADSVGVDLELGAALGVGAGFSVSFEVSPAETVDAITDFGGDLVDGITGGWW